jgi:hypothetical protein
VICLGGKHVMMVSSSSYIPNVAVTAIVVVLSLAKKAFGRMLNDVD